MGDKNNLARVTNLDVQAKTGHGILKSVYVTVPGDRIFEIIDGLTDCDTTVFSMDLTADTLAPITLTYINHPMADGIRIQHVSGATGEIVVIFE